MEKTPKTQDVMGWKVAASLFLIATGAGSYLAGFLFGLMDPAGSAALSTLTVILGAPFVIVGGGLLLCDMGQKSKFYHMVSRPGSSWMSRGTFFLILFVLFNLIHLFAGSGPAAVLLTSPAVYFTIRILASVLALLTLVYTGFVLGVVKAIPFWSSAFLAWLFLFSGLSTGSMAASLVFSMVKLAGGGGTVQHLIHLARFNFFFIILEAIVLATYLNVMKSRSPGSVRTLTRGKLAGVFWGGVVVAALIVPCIIEALKSFVMTGPASLLVLTLIGGIIGLIGGYMLRHVIVYGGTRIPLNVQGQSVAPPPEKYETKVIDAAYQSFQKA
jgi:formate-dependent nitrite reductase membrane component NrfD